MLVLETEDVPDDDSAQRLEQGNDEDLEQARAAGQEVDGPAEAQDDVDDDGDVVHWPYVGKGQLVAQEGVACVRAKKRPIHEQVPRARVDRVDDAEEAP